MTIDELTKILDAKRIKWIMTGSRVICDPPVMDTDIDIVILSLGGFDPENLGFKCTNGDSDVYEECDFDTYQLGNLNLIHVRHYEVFRAWRWATRAATAMNLRSKDDRIEFFQGCLYGNWIQ